MAGTKEDHKARGGPAQDVCPGGCPLWGIPPGVGVSDQSWGVSPRQQSSHGEESGHTAAPAEPEGAWKELCLLPQPELAWLLPLGLPQAGDKRLLLSLP